MWLKLLVLSLIKLKYCRRRRKYWFPAILCNSTLTLTFSQTTNLRLFQTDFSKLEEFADDNFKFDENGRKFSKRIENTVGKGAIAHYVQFLLFPQLFQKTCTANTQKPGLVWERVISLLRFVDISEGLYNKCV